MSKRWLEKDNFIAGTEERGDDLIITHAQDIDPYLKAAHAQRRGNFLTDDGYSGQNNMRKVGSVPDVVYTQWIKEDPELASNPNKLIRKLKEAKEKGFDFTVVEKI